MEETADWNQALPFSEKKQDAAIGHLLIDDRFFLQARLVVRPEWFVQPNNQRIWKCLVDFYEKYKSRPSKEEILDFGDFKGEDAKTKLAIEQRLNLCIHETKSFNVNRIKEELTVWLHTRVFHESVNKSINLFNKEHFHEAYEKLAQATKTINTISFENDLEEKFDTFEAEFAKSERELENACTFGLPMIDKLLVDVAYDSAVPGGLLMGDTTIILAPTNIGKTSVAINIARHNILRNKDVLILTHEGRAADIKEKIWKSMMNCSRAGLLKGYKTPEGREIIREKLSIIEKQLTYVPMNKPGLTVEEVEVVIRRKTDEKWAKTGKGFDMVLDDYPAKLTTILAKGGHLEKRHIDDIVYNYFVQLALELKFHSVNIIQTNREGSKINKRKSKNTESRLLTMEDVSEAWGPMTTATNVFTVNRDASKDRDRTVFYIDKSRSSQTGIAIVCQGNYKHCITHDPSMPHTYYRSSANMGERLAALLETYQGKEIPEYKIEGEEEADEEAK